MSSLARLRARAAQIVRLGADRCLALHRILGPEGQKKLASTLQDKGFRSRIENSQQLPKWRKTSKDRDYVQRFETTLSGQWLAPELTKRGIKQVPVTIEVHGDIANVRHQAQYELPDNAPATQRQQVEQALQKTVYRAVNNEFAIAVLNEMQQQLTQMRQQKMRMQQTLQVRQMQANQLQVQMNVYQSAYQQA